MLSRKRRGVSAGLAAPPPSIRRNWLRRCLLLWFGLGHLFKRPFENLIHLAHEDELELALDLGRHLVEVGLVPLRDEHALDSGAVRGEHLLLETADGENAAPKRDLAGHRYVVPNADPRQHRDERREHRDTGARPILRHRAGRNVDMDIALLEEVFAYAIAFGIRTDVRKRRLRRLFHDVAELPCELQLA